MSVHKYNSWGRTRQPKNVAGAHEAEVTVMAAAASTLTASASTEGYPTENQRYIHLYFSGSASGKNKDVDVWGYTYAFGHWAPLKDTGGNNVTIAKSGLGTAHAVFEVAGVDRVAFVDPNSAGTHKVVGTDTMMAAGSTFQGS